MIRSSGHRATPECLQDHLLQMAGLRAQLTADGKLPTDLPIHWFLRLFFVSGLLSRRDRHRAVAAPPPCFHAALQQLRRLGDIHCDPQRLSRLGRWPRSPRLAGGYGSLSWLPAMNWRRLSTGLIFWRRLAGGYGSLSWLPAMNWRRLSTGLIFWRSRFAIFWRSRL
jgi:hypothetical protein